MNCVVPRQSELPDQLADDPEFLRLAPALQRLRGLAVTLDRDQSPVRRDALRELSDFVRWLDSSCTA